MSKSESVALVEVTVYIKHKIEEKKRLEEEIKEAGAILESKNVAIQTIEEYKKLEEELKKHGFSIEIPRTHLSILQTINQMGYDPQKIVTELARIKSFRQTERRLKNNCKMLESHVNRWKEVLPLCEEIISFGIGTGELLALDAAVIKKIVTEITLGITS